MKQSVFVHIGLGKTATTTLQKHVFKPVAAANGFQYYGTKSLRPYLRSLNQRTTCPPFTSDAPSFVSCEAFAGWDPGNWSDFADRNLAHFGAEATILLIIRSPKAYLKSVYLQCCVHMGNLMEPREFFREHGRHVSNSDQAQFNISEFDYGRLIELYRSRFNRVIVQKFESQHDIKFLTEQFEISDGLQAQILQNLKKRHANKGYSQAAVDLTFRFGRQKQEDFVFKRKLRHRIWRKFIQFGYDKVVRSPPYALDMDRLPMINIEKLEGDYKNIPNYQVIGRGS